MANGDAARDSRRQFLKGTGGAFGLAGPVSFMLTKNSGADDDHDYGKGRNRGCGTRAAGPYGPLKEVKDGSTGLPLLMLPRGFRYWSHSWTGDKLGRAGDKDKVPSGHDGMAVVKASRGRHSKSVFLIRNHEKFGLNEPFATNFNYDEKGAEGLRC